MNKGFDENCDFRRIKMSMLNQACEANFFASPAAKVKTPCGSRVGLFTLAAYKVGWYSAGSKPT